MEVPVNVAAKALLPLVKAVGPRVTRLRAERSAAREPLRVQTDLLNQNLKETLRRLCGGFDDDSWWPRVLARMEQQYVAARAFFRTLSVQCWLGEVDVQKGIISLARANVMGQSAEGEAETRRRLSESYSEHTGEPERSAKDPIDVTVAVLVAGFIASIPENQRPVAGMIQEVHGGVKNIERQLHQVLEPDAVVQSAHAKAAEDELSKILTLWMFDFDNAIERVRDLWRRVDGGNLAAVPEPVRARVGYWVARLLASTFKAVDDARSIRQGLSSGDTDENLHVLDALIKAGDDADGAFRMLREDCSQDARSVLLWLLAHFRGERAALEWCADLRPNESPEHFTASGWRKWAVCLCSAGRWTEAADGLRAVASNSEWRPDLAMVEGLVNAALLIPAERRKLVFEGFPTYAEVAPNLGGEARTRHARARECFEHVVRCLSGTASKGLSDFLADWRMWVELMDPATARADLARTKVRERLEGGDMGEGLVSLAWAFGIEFDAKELRARLKRHRLLGGLGDEERRAEFLLNHGSMSPGDFAAYVEGRMERLDQVMSKSVTTAMLFDALLEDGQVERARAMVEKRRHHVDEELAAILDVGLDARGGKDPGACLEALYRGSGELVDLKTLVSHLMTVDDREGLRPLLRELFDRESTLEHAFEVVRCLSHPPADHGAILEFLEANPTVVEESDDMKSAFAWALFGMGRTTDSRGINDALLASRHSRNDLELDLKIAVATGDWERLSAIVVREWPRRREHDAELLMILAWLASQVGQSTERAIELAGLAVEKAPNDPNVLTAAYGIHLTLGRDGDADPEWLNQALANSTEEGPIWRTDFQKMVNVWLPRMRERNERIHRMLMGGEMPLAVASELLNMPLSRALLASEGENALDGRGRAVVPIISATRPRMDLGAGWTVGVDLTSILVLSRIGLLETTLDALEHVKLAPDAMQRLFADRVAVRFHQPARVDSARHVRRLIDQRRLKLVDQSTPPSAGLAEEVGIELATLLEERECDEGVVVCVRPIHRAGSLMQEVADTTVYDRFILSPADLCSLAHRAGLTDADQAKRATIFLASQGQTAGRQLSQSSLSGPIFIHGLALSYLQHAQVLTAIANGDLDLRILSTEADEINALIDAGDAGEELAESIDGIRDSLRANMESGKVTLLPLPPERLRDSIALVSVDSLAGLLFASGECDALCVDDRFVNIRLSSKGPTGKSVPLVCVLDLLRHLRARDVISDERYWGARHKLRQAGFAFIPLEAEELLNHLLSAEFEDGRMLESAELRVIRQTVNRVDSLELLSGGEARALGDAMVLACREVIWRLWSDAALEAQVAGALCSWVWWHLGMATFLLWRDLESDGGAAAFREAVVRRMRMVMIPPVVDSFDRRSAYREWLEQSVLVRLRPANDDLVEEAATAIFSTVKGAGKDVRVVAAVFLECLPEALRERIVNADPAFAEDCGFSITHRVVIGGGLSIAEADLLSAARTVYAGAETARLAPIGGTDAALSRAGDDEQLVASWTDAQGETHRVQIPGLTLVSGNAKARTQVLDEIVGRLGPTAQETCALHKHASSRRLTQEEVSVVFGEMTTGVAAVQSRLVSKIAQRWQANLADVVPPSRSYWERFCGPVPNGPDADTYFREQLIPYRKGLIESNMRVGLDICCLGALRDDLSPGAWLHGIDDETVWNALTAVPVQGNPIALLAVLDVALYRTGDDRFRQLADDVMGMLLDDHLGLPESCDIYRFLEVLTDFEMDHLGLVEGAGRYPGFWRRMCAWMQAGLIVRAAVACDVVPEVEHFEEWCKRHKTPVEGLRQLVDCRAEPLVLGHMRRTGSLRNEVLGRLVRLKRRHEKAGRCVPKAAEIESHQLRKGRDRSVLASAVPGPAEMHHRPREPIPKAVADALAEAWIGVHPAEALAQTAYFSQCFLLGDSQLENVRVALATIAGQVEDDEFANVAKQLQAASIVAAAARDTGLADSIGAAASGLVGMVSRPEDLDSVIRVLFQAAAAHAEESEWCKWLATRLAEVAERLPKEASECKRWLWCLLDSMAVVLPIRSWVHVRAKQMAGVALEAAP